MTIANVAMTGTRDRRSHGTWRLQAQGLLGQVNSRGAYPLSWPTPLVKLQVMQLGVDPSRADDRGCRPQTRRRPRRR